MDLITGEIPPLHRRFNEASSLAAIRTRYSKLRQHCGAQVHALQNDIESRILLRSFYPRGYKDWHIVSAVYNIRLNWEFDRLGLDFGSQPSTQQMEQINDIISLSVESPTRFANEQHIEQTLRIFDVNTLRTYGFEYRRRDYRPEAVQTFLRLRMKHYDLDLPHQPLFGKPPGDWPEV